MATYNFTVRATDNTGSFADRNFQMTVNNTQVDRFMISGGQGLARSVDGVTWNVEPGMFGDSIRWDNNMWVQYGTTRIQTSGLAIRTSVDGLNWVTLTPVFGTPRIAYQTPIYLGFTVIKYRKGIWVATVNVNASTASTPTTYFDEYTSPDLINWTATGRTLGNMVTASGASNISGVQDFEYDPTTDAWVYLVTNSGPTAGNGQTLVYRRTGITVAALTPLTTAANGIFGSPLPAPINVGNANTTAAVGLGRVFFQNGLWVISLGYTGVWTSVDSLNWFFRDTSPVSGAGVIGPVFSNGRLLLQPITTSTTGLALLQSINAGHVWTTRTTVSGQPVGTFAAINTYRQQMAAYGGTLITGNSSGGTVSYSKDDGLTWLTAVTGAGATYAIATRDT